MLYDGAVRGRVASAPAEPDHHRRWRAILAEFDDARVSRAEQPALECKACGETKPRSEFYVSNLATCRECHKARVRQRARVNPAVQEYERKRAKEPHRRELNKRVSERWAERNPQGRVAHSALNNAIRAGKIAKEPCLFCGAEKVHAHHRDYSKALDVIWLCPRCHHRLHKYFPETEAEGKGDAPADA